MLSCVSRCSRLHMILWQATFVPQLRARTEEAKQEDLKIAPTAVRSITTVELVHFLCCLHKSVGAMCWECSVRDTCQACPNPELGPAFVIFMAQDHLLWDSSRAPDERRLQQLVKASGHTSKCNSKSQQCPNRRGSTNVCNHVIYQGSVQHGALLYIL